MALLQKFARVFLYIVAGIVTLFVVVPWALHMIGDMITHHDQASEVLTFYINGGVNAVIAWMMINIIPAAVIGFFIWFGFFKKAGGGGGGGHH